MEKLTEKSKILSPGAFCAEYHYKTMKGAVCFSPATVKKFCTVYTYLDYPSLSKIDRAYLKNEMIRLSNRYLRLLEPEIWDGNKIELIS